MGQSLVNNYVHLIFSTKHRQPFIQEAIEADLHNFMTKLCNDLDCSVLKIGGHVDHVHILCMLSSKVALMKLLEYLKSKSSRWMKTQGEAYRNFYWQDGYGAFSVSHRHVNAVIKYIANQHEHHKNQTFQEEYRLILTRYNIKYIEQYLWD